MKKILIINSAKGGVGKTEVSTGIAKALKAKGKKVAIMDLDVTTPNVDEIKGIELYTSASRAEKSKTQIKKLISSVIRKSDAEYIIVDTPPTIGSTYMAITETIKNPSFIFVTTPSKNAVLDTSAGVKFFASRGFPPSGIVQNMTGSLFGDLFDSEKIMGVPTVGEIPFTENRKPYFEKLAEHVESMDFGEGGVKASVDKEKIMSKLTLQEAKNNKDIEPAFYNLETWPYFQDIIVNKEMDIEGNRGSFSKSRFSVNVKKLEQIINAGETVDIMVMGKLHIDRAPIPYEIQEAKVIYDHKFSKGIPMMILNNGVTLWPDEVSVIDDSTIKEALDLGGIDLGNGRILQSLFQTMYLCRAFGLRGESLLNQEKTLVRNYLEESEIEVTPKEIIYSVYKLENDGEDSLNDFDYEKYIENNKEKFPDFAEHLESLMDIVEGKIKKEKPTIESTIKKEEDLEVEGPWKFDYFTR